MSSLLHQSTYIHDHDKEKIYNLILKLCIYQYYYDENTKSMYITLNWSKMKSYERIFVIYTRARKICNNETSSKNKNNIKKKTTMFELSK